jgi:hypothetical protein
MREQHFWVWTFAYRENALALPFCVQEVAQSPGAVLRTLDFSRLFLASDVHRELTEPINSDRTKSAIVPFSRRKTGNEISSRTNFAQSGVVLRI